jgi:hypothetical protein
MDARKTDTFFRQLMKASSDELPQLRQKIKQFYKDHPIYGAGELHEPTKLTQQVSKYADLVVMPIKRPVKKEI